MGHIRYFPIKTGKWKLYYLLQKKQLLSAFTRERERERERRKKDTHTQNLPGRRSDDDDDDDETTTTTNDDPKKVVALRSRWPTRAICRSTSKRPRGCARTHFSSTSPIRRIIIIAKKKKNNNNNNNDDDALFNAEKKKFSDVVSLLRGIVHHEHAAKRDALRGGFDASAGLVPKKKRNENGRDKSERGGETTLKGPTEHEALSAQFVTQFCEMMATAEYSILTEEEWKLAMEEDFMFRLPMEIDWANGGYDASLLRAFLKKNPELKVGLPKFSERVLLFKRGVTVSTHSDLFVSEKIDLLLEYALKRPVGKALRKVFGFGRSSGDGEESAAAVGRNKGKKNVSKIERRTLRRLMPTTMSVLKNLHKSSS